MQMAWWLSIKKMESVRQEEILADIVCIHFALMPMEKTWNYFFLRKTWLFSLDRQLVEDPKNSTFLKIEIYF